MDVFKAVKKNVTARRAADHYGIRVNGSGMARCPFHNDKNPSLKLDKRFHCFGCAADGDVISFAAQLFKLCNKEAAEKLAEDFGISYKERRTKSRKVRQQAKQQDSLSARYEKTEQNFYKTLADYYHLLQQWKKERAPKSLGEEWDEYFCEAVQNIDTVEYVMNRFLNAGLEEKIDIMNDYGKKVKGFERRSQQYRREEAGKA